MKKGCIHEDIFQLLREQGLLEMTITKGYGGAGRDILSFCLVLEKIAKVCYNTTYILAMTHVPSSCILVAGGHMGKVTSFCLQ